MHIYVYVIKTCKKKGEKHRMRKSGQFEKQDLKIANINSLKTIFFAENEQK